MSPIQPIQWDPDRKVLTLLDQTRLPLVETHLHYTDPTEVAGAIRGLVVRGAPAIGCAAAFGTALGAVQYTGSSFEELDARVRDAMGVLARSRPTAVNLFWALDRMEKLLDSLEGRDCGEVREALEGEAVRIFAEDLAACQAMGDFGASLVPGNARILTHCNAGALATAGYGTALGVIRSAHRDGKVSMVWVDETRPVLQGARLTAWEMVREMIPATLITDNMAGAVMAAGKVDFVVVGSDRIAANGDVANKIGTYSVAVLARRHNIPFVVAAPVSTIDFEIPSGDGIPIEERDPEEVAGYGSERWAPEGMRIYNPAFDVTPAELITAIVTERGILMPPYAPAIANIQR
ncbi:MAG: S-methyl-5-thioribose-1-phosphate isomerase [bacterium]|nr:MAG: S-methyl-5-thioribose-1-phosphate isomerase [bacterium]